jgi:hypothetical protein
MSFKLDAFIARLYCEAKSESVQNFYAQKRHPTNGLFYLMPIQDTIHYKAAISQDYTLYQDYINTIPIPQAEHSADIFKTLYDTFDINKMEKIKVNVYHHTDWFWVQDGIHRLCCLIVKGYIKDGRIPIQYCEVTFHPETIEQISTIVKATTVTQHGNGWNNGRGQYGYHTIQFANLNFQGQRKPLKRLEKIKKFYDFTDKIVLDLGCNTGGMLLHIPEIKHGVGLDFDAKCIDAAKYMARRFQFAASYTFHQQDLNEFDCVKWTVTNNIRPDIIFLLSIGSWVKNWKALYTNAWNTAPALLLETNNDTEGMEQLQLFLDLGARITLVSAKSDDDCTGNVGRKTFLVERQSTSST